MKKGHFKTGNIGAHMWTTIPGFHAFTECVAPDDNDPKCNLSTRWKMRGELKRVPNDAKGEVIQANKLRALVKWQSPLLAAPLFGWIDREYLTAEPPQTEMPIDGGFALVAETAPDPARIAREAREKADREERARAAQLSLF